MLLNPYLNFDGNCREAFTFYHQVLGGEIQAMMTFEGTPMAEQIPPELRDKIIIHARLAVGGQVLMGSDAMPGQYEPVRGISVTLGIDKPAEAERVFGELAAGGTVTMPIQQTFWAARFGMLTDRFGIPWMINCEQPPTEAR